jgi:hypothetical protein
MNRMTVAWPIEADFALETPYKVEAEKLRVDANCGVQVVSRCSFVS